MSQFQSTLKIIHIVNVEVYKLFLYYVFCDMRGHRFITLTVQRHMKQIIQGLESI